jgi:hypothetical protein
MMVYFPRLNSASNLKQLLPLLACIVMVPEYWPAARRNLSLYDDMSTFSPFEAQALTWKKIKLNWHWFLMQNAYKNMASYVCLCVI